MQQDQHPDLPAGASGAWRWELVGLSWPEAEQMLKARSLPFETVVTAPPNRPVGVGELRVVAERPRPEGSLLVLAHRDYQRPSL